MDDEKPLTNKLRRYVEGLSRGLASFPAAKNAGYSDSYARVIATRTKNNHMVAQALDHIRAEGRRLAVYDLATAMREAEEVIVFAKANKAAMAYLGAVQHRAKLSGLLVDKFEVVHADLCAALQRAEQRIIQILPVVTNGTAVNWTPQIAGDSGTEDQEETPVDGQVKEPGVKHG